MLLLRLDAPLMSFGGVCVDSRHPTLRYPSRSLLAGLLGNALGLRYEDVDQLHALQSSLRCAARWDVEPRLMSDYQTVDLGQPKMAQPGWTTRGCVEHREGGPDAALGTHILDVNYLEDGVMTLAVSVCEAAPYDVPQLAEAVRTPSRPLYLGRKTCAPAAPLLLGVVEASTLLSALRTAPLSSRVGSRAPVALNACWPVGEGDSPFGRETTLADEMDWRNRVHVGEGRRVEGRIEVST